ncbi:hypothetical protein MSP8887_04035 [Marinomonas spartinae]|uniref:Uncharacterized protein n=1 Tax=Marinomonas spartinae TaxID=1792290 RepID=A0A1A8T2I0_9GAMM|nr:hypothetical protein [Marinomonas spartinae]SBS25932.1 hypothetical protein MSP8886_00431 [Marinomonas spartinae]SBS39849.1 hypothetical protein MSP8887_04035 [Marinomonas spartinae]
MKFIFVIAVLTLIVGCNDPDATADSGLEFEQHTIEVDGESVVINTTKGSELTDEDLKEMFSSEDLKAFLKDEPVE